MVVQERASCKLDLAVDTERERERQRLEGCFTGSQHDVLIVRIWMTEE